ncbi:right-handed parallel beta-helix repeat-containing protein [Candidatus Bipolaricaulota bacterium]|nr:right-handed parallel beta-helix repeat-containing protein [Candidatus Bipolaricaulota bacterium]
MRAILRRMAIGAVILLLVCPLSCTSSPEGNACTITVRAGEAIQPVLDAASPGAVICLPPGVWTESLRVAKAVTLRGAGPGRTTIRGQELGQPVIQAGPEAEEVILVGITFTGAMGSCPDPAGCAHGLLATGEARVRVENCAFSENAADGVQARDGAHVALTKVTSTKNGGYGLRAQQRAQVEVRDSVFTRNRTAGIWLAGAARLDLGRSEVAENERLGGWIRDDAALIAEGSHVIGNRGHGLWVRDRATVTLTACTIADSVDVALVLEGDCRVTATDCRIERGWYAVDARDSSQVRLAACTVVDCRWDGIRLSGSSRAQILGCTLIRGRGSGIRVTGLAQAEISHNRIESWSTYGIFSLASSPPWGVGNRLAENGVDLAGNLPGEMREPRVVPSLAEAKFPDPRFRNLQEAVDAVLPGGRLVVEAGVHRGGITIGKSIRIEGDGSVLLTGCADNDAPVLSLVGGAECELVAISLGYGSEGLMLGADARASLVDCVISDNSEGIRASDAAYVTLLRCRLSRNERGGMWLWGRAEAEIEECVFTENGSGEAGMSGPSLGVGGAAWARITRSTITGSGWKGAIFLRDSAGAEIWENSIRGNAGVGVIVGPCADLRYRFAGWVEGGGNEFRDNKGDVCPDELAFLTGAGGAFDLRP